MKKLLIALVTFAAATTVQAQILPSFDLELGYSVSADGSNSIQSLRYVKDNGLSVQLDINTNDGLFPSGFPGGSNEFGGVYVGFEHSVLEGLMEGLSFELATGFITDVRYEMAANKLSNSGLSFKNSMKYALPIEQVDAKLELSYLLTSLTEQNGLYIGLSSRWSLF